MRAVLGPVSVHVPLAKSLDELYVVHAASLYDVSFAWMAPDASAAHEYVVPLWQAPSL